MMLEPIFLMFRFDALHQLILRFKSLILMHVLTFTKYWIRTLGILEKSSCIRELNCSTTSKLRFTLHFQFQVGFFPWYTTKYFSHFRMRLRKWTEGMVRFPSLHLSLNSPVACSSRSSSGNLFFIFLIRYPAMSSCPPNFFELFVQQGSPKSTCLWWSKIFLDDAYVQIALIMPKVWSTYL